jgi:DNA replication and repair protein RecF
VRLVNLVLHNYRNYAHVDLEADPGLNVFLGANAQGKTNLLEAVALLALSSSPRARRDRDLIGPLAPEARVEALIESDGRERHLQIELGGARDSVSPNASSGHRARKRIEVDGQSRRAVDLPGHFRVSLFWPDDLSLARSGPEHRRRLLNQMLVQVEPGYAAALARYSRAVEQRNHLLRQIAAGSQSGAVLEAWDLQLAGLGELLSQARQQAVIELRQEAAASHAAISGGEKLDLSYEGPPQPLLPALLAARKEDLRRGTTSVGPHRDDMPIWIDGREARSFASQGQQRTAVVSIKLGEAAVLSKRSGEAPVLLFDDVLSELDARRRTALLERLAFAGQVIVTSVETDPFPADVIQRARVRWIVGGLLKDCG